MMSDQTNTQFPITTEPPQTQPLQVEPISQPQPNPDIIMTDINQPEPPLSQQALLKKVFTSYLQEHTVYETIPENMKILVFNSELTIKDSIDAMIKEDIYCGLLWDTTLSKYVGLFTIRDVLSLIRLAYTQCVTYLNKNTNITSFQSIIDELFKLEMPITTTTTTTNPIDTANQMEIDIDASKKNAFDTYVKNFSDFFKLFDSVTINQYIGLYKDKNRKLISLSLDGNLQESIKLIKENKIHRIVVEDLKSSTITGFITYEAIFEFFIENYYSDMTEFNMSIKELNIVSKDVITLDKKETIFKCMETFYTKRISLIPIIDKDNNNEIFGYVYLKDIMYFFSNGDKFTFSDPIEHMLIDIYEDIDMEKPLGKERIVEVNVDTNLKEVLEQMSICPERKLIVRENNDIGIITLSNIFSELME